MSQDLWGYGWRLAGGNCEVCGEPATTSFEGQSVCEDCAEDAQYLPPVPTEPRTLYRGLYADPSDVHHLLSQGLGRFWTDDPGYAEQFARGNGKEFARQGVGTNWGPTHEEFSRHRPLVVETDWDGTGHTTDLGDRFRMDGSEYRLNRGTPLTVNRIRQLPEQPGEQERDLLSHPINHTAARSRLAMPYYHNTDAELNPGDMLLPASETGHSRTAPIADQDGVMYHPDRVYFYNHPTEPSREEISDESGAYSGTIGFGKNTYEVEPDGPVERDPEWQTNWDKWGDLYDDEDEVPGYHDYMAPRARVVRKVEPRSDPSTVWGSPEYEKRRRKARMMSAAQRLAMPAWYHNTHNPNFKPNPNHEPANVADEDDPTYGRPGMFITQHPDEWPEDGDGEPYGYRVEFDGPEDMGSVPGAVDISSSYDRSFWIPADQYHRLRQVQITRNKEARTMTAAQRLAMPAVDAYDSDRVERIPAPAVPNGPWYHGSDHDLPDQTVLTPGGGGANWSDFYRGGGGTRSNRRDWVWLSHDPYEASLWGSHVYQVEPHHEGPWPWNGPDAQQHDGLNRPEGYVSPQAHVVRKLHPDEYEFPSEDRLNAEQDYDDFDEMLGDHQHDYHSKPRKARTMTAAVTVYTKPSCPQCDMTHKLLNRLGIEHTTVDVTADPEAHAYVTGLGYQSAPVVVVNDGEDHWGGFKVDRLKGLVE